MGKEQSIYTVGGTVQAGSGIYIERAADKELLELCRKGELAFILSSRQVGKSSLMVRTAEELKKENIRSAIIDLSAIGVNVISDEWYLGILNEIATSLKLESNIFTWWNRSASLSPAQRLSNFFRDVLLEEVKDHVVLFFDEIDSTLSIPFSDDFFAALRSIYNARSTTIVFRRLSFVLIGVASPSELISDSSRTPFNIGHRVELNDFTLEEVQPLAKELSKNANHILECVLNWTGGHPYLTQRLCAYLAKNTNDLTEIDVTAAVEKLFLGEDGKKDNNLQFVRDMLLERAKNPQEVLQIYQNILSNEQVRDDEYSISKTHLKLAGVVKRRLAMLLKVSNKIYSQVFGLSWVKEHLPLMELQNLLDARAFQWSKNKDHSRLLRGKELIDAESLLLNVKIENYRNYERVQEFIQVSRKAENLRKKQFLWTTAATIITILLCTIFATRQVYYTSVAQATANAAKTQSGSNLATARAENTRAASIGSTATAALSVLDVNVNFLFDECSCSGNYQVAKVILNINNGVPPFSISNQSPVNERLVTFPVPLGSSFPLEITSSDGLSWKTQRIVTPLKNSCQPPTSCNGGNDNGGENCSLVSETLCEDIVVTRTVCVDWTGTNGKCRKWEDQETLETVCSIEEVCKDHVNKLTPTVIQPINECNDNIDNDADGKIDGEDPQCKAGNKTEN